MMRDATAAGTWIARGDRDLRVEHQRVESLGRFVGVLLGGRGQSGEFAGGIDDRRRRTRARHPDSSNRSTARRCLSHEEVVAVHARHRGVQAPGERRAQGCGIRSSCACSSAASRRVRSRNVRSDSEGERAAGCLGQLLVEEVDVAAHVEDDEVALVGLPGP